MNKLELIAMLKNECSLSKKETAAVVDLFFESMSEALARSDRVEIRGLCSFYVKILQRQESQNRGKRSSSSQKTAIFQVWQRIKRTRRLLNG
jgi:nucleoid DNA-binding protein